ncbi:hypothetical protein MRB53_004184, partial [Persea americana]
MTVTERTVNQWRGLDYKREPANNRKTARCCTLKLSGPEGDSDTVKELVIDAHCFRPKSGLVE